MAGSSRQAPLVQSRTRRGVALVAVLALLAIGSALVMGTFGAARSAAAAAEAARASARAEAGARRGLARLVSDWDPALDSLPIGTRGVRRLPPDDRDRAPLGLTGTVRRLAGTVFLVVVEAEVRSGPARVARRRYRMLVEAAPAGDSAAARARPRRIGGWSLDETN